MPNKNVLVLDTSILCVWLKVPGKDTCGSGGSRIDFAAVNKQIEAAVELRHTLVLPLASIIETGNHIAQAPQYRFERATDLAKLMVAAADAVSPWAAFGHQQALWKDDGLKKLASEWPKLAAQKLSIGDATITQVADYYAQMGCHVEIFTGDLGLKQHQLAVIPPQPRRRK